MEHGSLESVRVTSNRSGETSAPLISAVVSCYNVAPFLVRFLENLDHQPSLDANVELIFVIDGSPDESREIIADWMRRTSHRVTLAEQPNRGLSGARNTGIRLSQGRWVTFPDADDRLSPAYFEKVIQAIAQFPDADMFTTRLVREHVSGARGDHALDFRYKDMHEATRVDLAERPEMIHLHSNMAFLRTEHLAAADLWFDERLRKGFEDAHLIAKYLLSLRTSSYVLVPTAEYHYVAHPGSITAQPDFAKYIDIIRFAYFDILERTEERRPDWVAFLLLYDMWWLFREQLNMLSAAHGLSAAEQGELHDLTREVLGRLHVDQIRSFRIVNVTLDVRSAWEAASSEGEESHVAVLRSHDRIRRLQKIAFHSADPHARAEVLLDGSSLSIAFSKVREILFFDRPWMYEHIYWVDVFGVEKRVDELDLVGKTPGLDFLFDGRAYDARTAGRLMGKTRFAKPPRTLRRGRAYRKWAHLRWRGRKISERLSYAVPYRIGRLIGLRTRFAEAWVLMDRDIQANDNAEGLYRYISAERRDINVWFVINKSSPDFKRLKREGFKVIPYGTKRHFLLMKEARVLASSMLDHYVLFPFPRTYLPKTWTYSFLQHGVIHNRLHRWLNFKDIDHLVTSTRPEYDSIAGSPSPYKLSAREVELTGMPRHDRLFQLNERHRALPERKQRIVLMPTWRNYLFGAAKGGSRERIDGFFESEYVREWSNFFNSDYLAELCRRPDMEVVLLPHPNIDSHWTDLRTPPGMKRVSYVGDDTQEIVAGASLVVTDYSSQAFEGAFCGAPTVYFQFDRDEFFAGGHVASPGYFDHRTDGFGPVCEDAEALDRNLRLMVDGTHPEIPAYSARIHALFPLRDDQASKRVTESIEQRMRPYGEAFGA